MVVEIGYEQYKQFCSMLVCKDIFYYLETLFIKYPNDDKIYAVKFPAGSDIEKLFNKLRKNNKVVEMSLSDFKRGCTPVNNTIAIDENMYNGKNVLVVIDNVNIK